MHVHERDRAGNLGTRSDEDRTPDLDPELPPARLGHHAIVPDQGTRVRERRKYRMAGPAGAEPELLTGQRQVPGGGGLS
jgi:hypothetical protein